MLQPSAESAGHAVASAPDRPLPALPHFPVLAGLAPSARASLLAELPRRRLAPGECAIREGEPNDSLVLVLSGHLRAERGADTGNFVLVHLGPGDCGGEMSALTGGSASASVRAVTEASVALLPPERLHREATGSVAVRLAELVIHRLSAIDARLEEKRRHARDAMELRLRSAIFASKLLGCLSGYILLVGAAGPLAAYWPPQVLVSAFFIVAFFGAAWAFVTRVSNLQRYGMAPRTAGVDTLRGLWYTIPVLVAVLLAKIAFVTTHPGHAWFQPLFGLRGTTDTGWTAWVCYVAGYAALSYAQEVVRCAIQGCIADYLRGGDQPDRWRSIALSSLLFGATHVHLSLTFAVLAALGGVWWGWLYQRERSFWTVAASHAVAGVWAIFIVGVPE